MAGTSDKVFLRAFRWFKAAVEQLENEIPSGGGFDLSGTLTDILRTKLGLQLDKTEATIDPSTFSATRAEAESLAIAAMVTGETMAALRSSERSSLTSERARSVSTISARSSSRSIASRTRHPASRQAPIPSPSCC